MSRRFWSAAIAAWLLLACDDGVLRAFEPHAAALGGMAGMGGSAEPGTGGSAEAGTGGSAEPGTGGSAEAGGGRGSTAGAPSAGAGPAEPTSPLLIDDFEDGDMRAKEPRGWWYPINDGTDKQGIGIEPISEGTTSVYALRTHGGEFGDWGAALGVNLIGESTPLNAVGYERLCFVARVEADGSSSIAVHILREPGVHYEQDVSLSESWTRYCLPLANFLGADGALMPDELIALQFFFPPGARFEFWLDEVEIEP
jgi:hypothetical protein